MGLHCWAHTGNVPMQTCWFGTLKAPPESRLAVALEGDRVLHLVLPKQGAVTDSPSLGLLTPWEDLLQQWQVFWVLLSLAVQTFTRVIKSSSLKELQGASDFVQTIPKVHIAVTAQQRAFWWPHPSKCSCPKQDQGLAAQQTQEPPQSPRSCLKGDRDGQENVAVGCFASSRWAVPCLCLSTGCVLQSTSLSASPAEMRGFRAGSWTRQGEQPPVTPSTTAVSFC